METNQQKGINSMPRNKYTDKRYSLKTGNYMGIPNMKYPNNWVDIYLDYKMKRKKLMDILKETNIPKSSFYKLFEGN